MLLAATDHVRLDSLAEAVAALARNLSPRVLARDSLSIVSAAGRSRRRHHVESGVTHAP